MFHIRGTAEETAREACVWGPVKVRQVYLQASGTSAVEELSRGLRNISTCQEHQVGRLEAMRLLIVMSRG